MSLNLTSKSKNGRQKYRHTNRTSMLINFPISGGIVPENKLLSKALKP